MLFGIPITLMALGEFGSEIRWSGGYQLEYTLARQTDRKIARISAEAVARKEWADDIRADVLVAELRSEPFVPVTNGPFFVRVRCGGRRSGLLGRELSYFHFELLVLRIDYEDGKVEYATAEIPDARKQRRMTIEVP